MITFVAGFFLVAPAEPPTDPVQRYMNCVVWRAGDLEHSGEAANLIAEAAAPRCEPLLNAGATRLTDEFLSKPEMVNYLKSYPFDRAASVARNAELLRKSAIQGAQQLVIELRAKRNRANNAKN